MSVKRPRRSRHSTRGGRSFPEGTESELDPHNVGIDRWPTPEEASATRTSIASLRQAIWKKEAYGVLPQNEYFDSLRRQKLLWASELVQDAQQEEADSKTLLSEAEELVDAACPNCAFYERCALVGVSMHVVRELADPKTRQQFDDEMSAPYGAPFVSCEYVIPHHREITVATSE